MNIFRSFHSIISSREISTADDETWLVELARNDPGAFGELYELYYSRILNFIYRHVFDVHDAETITSNTFFNVLKSLPQFRRTTTFRAWIYRIASNEIRMFWRSEKNRRNREMKYYTDCDDLRYFSALPESGEDAENEEKLYLFRILHESLNTLPEKYRHILILRYFEGLSLSEIAQVMETREGTVKSLIHRGLEKLQKKFSENCNISRNIAL